MTRRDYIELADALGAAHTEANNVEEKKGVWLAADRVAKVLATRGSFNAELFVRNIQASIGHKRVQS